MSSLPSEFDLVARYLEPLARNFAGAYGLLDDVATISPARGSELVVKSDAIVGGVDFPAETAAGLIARKALRVNLSDLAAKGAVPRAYLLDLILPSTVDEAWVAAFAAGLADDQRSYGVALAGGDISSTSGPVVIAISIFGEAAVGRITRRGGAQVGDRVFVTGTIGDAALGLAVLSGTVPAPDSVAGAFLLNRYQLPQPRVTLGPQLIGVATAGLDISDGLIADLGHVCQVSGLDAVIAAETVPLSSAARAVIAGDPQYLTTALTGGDDYELLFTAPPAAAARIAELARLTGVPITPIGYMSEPARARPRVIALDEQGRALGFAAEGWTHFGGR
jgi:thiamine-monophosphate kinase